MSQPKLLDQVRAVLRLRHYSIRTEEAYVQAIRRFILYHQKRHPREMGVDEIRQYLSHLATDGKVAASTQNVALCALLFLYRQVLAIDLPFIENIERANRPKRVPVVFTPQEVRRVLANLHGTHLLMASLLYGAGLRLMECIRLRVKDLDFQYKQITVRDGKGERDRRTMLPQPLIEPLQRHLARVKLQHEDDVRAGHGAVYLPYALERKHPSAATDWLWQYVFPSANLSKDPRTGVTARLSCFYKHSLGMWSSSQRVLIKPDVRTLSRKCPARMCKYSYPGTACTLCTCSFTKQLCKC